MVYWNYRSDFSQKCKNKLLILFVYVPVVFSETEKFGELIPTDLGDSFYLFFTLRRRNRKNDEIFLKISDVIYDVRRTKIFEENGHGWKWKLWRRRSLTLWQCHCPTLSRPCYNITTTLSIGFLGHFIMDNSDFLLAIETWESYKSTWVLNPVFGKQDAP